MCGICIAVCIVVGRLPDERDIRDISGLYREWFPDNSIFVDIVVFMDFREESYIQSDFCIWCQYNTIVVFCPAFLLWVPAIR